MSAIPDGFAPIGPTSPFNELVGPFYVKRDGPAFAIGMVVEPKHRNSHGIVHGGMICTLVDMALGYAARRHRFGRRSGCFSCSHAETSVCSSRT